MLKLLQINVTANWGSTGRIAEQIGIKAIEQGWDSYIAYGRYMNPSKNKLIKVGGKFNVYEHYLENRLLDNEGLASRWSTMQLIKSIDKLKPNIVHLHNIHDHWLNYKLLFKYLNTLSIPILWTQHDCWSFTGGCGYYSMINCNKWKVECKNCPKRTSFFDLSNKHYSIRKELFTANNNLILIPVSQWLANELKQSFLKKCKIIPIINGVDTRTFHPVKENVNEIRNKYGIGNRFMLVALATSWSTRKSFHDYIKLAKLLDDNFIIMLIGISEKQRKLLPQNIIGIERTFNIDELVGIYSTADIVLNLSREETFGLTTAEGYACGTPTIVYNATASPELVISETGVVVEQGDIEGVLSAIYQIKEKGKSFYSKACRKRAEDLYDKEKCFNQYIDLYNKLLDKAIVEVEQ